MHKEGHLKVKTYTWSKETHGLFQYYSKPSYIKNSFTLNNSSKIFRSLNHCYSGSSTKEENSLGLLDLEKKSNEFQISQIGHSSSSKIWLVISKLPSSKPGYKLSEGDYLKIGRVQLKVIKISQEPERSASNLIPHFFMQNLEKGKSKENASGSREQGKEVKFKAIEENENNEDLDIIEQSICRICLSESETVIDPLISPCKCAGSMQYIHLNCLKEWLHSKMTSKVSSKSMSYHIRDLICELCRSSFPLIFNYKDQKISLLSVDLPSSSYLILQEYRPENNSKVALHILTLDKNQSIQMGRGQDTDIKITDISVSRNHCKITRLDKDFYIEDLKSKFGTLAKVKKSFVLKPGVRLAIQVTRTVFKLNYKVPWTAKDICRCCFKEKAVIQSYSHLTQPDVHDSESDLDSSQIHLAGGIN